MSLYALSQQKDVPDFTGCVDNYEYICSNHEKRMYQILPSVSTIMSLCALSQQKDVPNFTGCVNNCESNMCQ